MKFSVVCSFDQSTSLQDQNPGKSMTRRIILHHNKEYICQIHTQHYIECGKTEIIFTKIRNETSVPATTTLSPLLLDIMLEILCRAIRQKKTGLHIRKEAVKLSLLAHMILYSKDPNDSTRRLLDLKNTFRMWQDIK